MPEAQANLNIIFISNIRDYEKFNDKNDKIVFLIQIDGEHYLVDSTSDIIIGRSLPLSLLKLVLPR
jgi:hypothetical protein